MANTCAGTLREMLYVMTPPLLITEFLSFTYSLRYPKNKGSGVSFDFAVYYNPGHLRFEMRDALIPYSGEIPHPPGISPELFPIQTQAITRLLS